MSYNNIALVYRSQGEYAKALEGHQKALGIWRAAYGERHPDVASSYNNIAVVYDSQGEYAKALEGHQKALEIRRAVYGERHPDVAESYNNIAVVYDSQGEYAKALEGFRALGIRRAVYGERHPEVAESYNNIAGVYNIQGEYAKALEGHQKALEIWHAVYGERHPNVATSYNNIVMTTDEGEYAKALEGARRCWRSACGVRRARTPTSPGATTTSRPSTPARASTPRRWRDSRRRWRSGVRCTASATPTSPQATTTSRRSTPARASTPRRWRATGSALEIRRAVYGERHPDVAESYNNIAVVYRSQGEFTSALDALDRALDALSMTADPTAALDAVRANARLRPLPLTVTVLQGHGEVRERRLGPEPVAGLRDCLRDYQDAADVLEQVRQHVLATDPSKLRLGEQSSELFPRTIAVAARLADAEGTPAARLAALAAAERGAAARLPGGAGPRPAPPSSAASTPRYETKN